jgi:hypothetical protein
MIHPVPLHAFSSADGAVFAFQASSDVVPYYRPSRLVILEDWLKHCFGRELVLDELVIVDPRSRGEQGVAVFSSSQANHGPVARSGCTPQVSIHLLSLCAIV